jgi:ligand-binding SRPBCC domain-containing protein
VLSSKKKSMPFYTLKRVQILPVTIETAWDFFSNPAKLQEITPKHLGFNITSDPQFLSPMYTGQVISYTITPILGIPLSWMTEIKHVEKHKLFVDEQRHGPYALWYHQHHFKVVPEGVEMIDLVHYKLPLGPLGQFAHWLFVKRQLKDIFDYRTKTIAAYFGPKKA